MIVLVTVQMKVTSYRTGRAVPRSVVMPQVGLVVITKFLKEFYLKTSNESKTISKTKKDVALNHRSNSRVIVRHLQHYKKNIQ